MYPGAGAATPFRWATGLSNVGFYVGGPINVPVPRSGAPTGVVVGERLNVDAHVHGPILQEVAFRDTGTLAERV